MGIRLCGLNLMVCFVSRLIRCVRCLVGSLILRCLICLSIVSRFLMV